MGPRTVPGARFNYNQTIVRSLNEQLLLNLVRLRYRDTPLFLDVGTVVAQYSFSGSASALPRFNVDGSDDTEFGLDLGVSVTENPTITYSPLKGAEFAQRILSPIAPSTIILLSRSGWSIERLLLCCVQQINDVPNAPSATGPTPSFVPENKDFRQLAHLLRRLQIAGALNFRLAYDDEQPTIFVRLMKPSEEAPWKAEMDEARRLLGISREQEVFRLTEERLRRGTEEIAISGRSLLGVFFFLSHTVEAPVKHAQQGLITLTAGPENRPFDWTTLTGELLRVRSQTSPPPQAFVRVRYREHWYYIEDADLNSKSTFNLLTYLSSLQAAGERAVSPLLTVPVGQ